MYHQFGAVLIFVFVGSFFVAAGLFAGSLIRRAKRSQHKHTVYECGEPTIGSSWIRYNSRFYNIALVYLLFDIEVVVLIPAALVIREKAQAGTAGAALIALLFFIFLLAVGLAYEWFYGNLDWIRRAWGEVPPEE